MGRQAWKAGVAQALSDLVGALLFLLPEPMTSREHLLQAAEG